MTRSLGIPGRKERDHLMKDLLTREGADLDRPYEKCLMYGASALTDAELIAVVLRSGTRGVSALELARKVLALTKDGSGLTAVCSLSAADYMTLPGIGEVKAIQLMCIGELSKRIATRRSRTLLKCTDPEAIAALYMEQLRFDPQEHLISVLLDTKMRMIGEERIAKGTANAAIISTRDIFLAALRHRAVALLLIHNHPSGDPSPSGQDIALTEKVRRAGELLDITLVDHIVIGDGSYVSFAENGLIEDEAGCS